MDRVGESQAASQQWWLRRNHSLSLPCKTTGRTKAIERAGPILPGFPRFNEQVEWPPVPQQHECTWHREAQ